MKSFLMPAWFFQLFSLRNFYLALFSLITFILILSAVYSELLDHALVEAVKADETWWLLVANDHIKKLFFSPLWLVATYLYSQVKALDHEHWERQKARLEGFLRGKDMVSALDVGDFIMDIYNPRAEHAAERARRDELVRGARGVAPEEQRV